MALQPLRVGFRLVSINYTEPQGTEFHWNTYLWAVFFKIDGDTTSLDESGALHGVATISGGSGDHGDLGDSQNPREIIDIPRSLGEYRTVLTPIPLNFLKFGGHIGCAVALNVQNGTPDTAIREGHIALNSALLDELNKLIPTLGTKKMQPTAGDIAGIESRVSDAVTSAIHSAVGLGDWLASLGAEDFQLGNSVFLKTQDDLDNAPPSGIPVQATYTVQLPVRIVNGGATGDVPVAELGTYSWVLTGYICADPLDFSLRRSMEFLGLDPAGGILKPLQSASLSSVRNWIVNISATYFAPGKQP